MEVCLSSIHIATAIRDTFVILICQRLLYSLLLLILPLQSLAQSELNQQASAVSETEPASLSLFVFAETQPQADVEISLDGNSIGRTQDSGRITASIEPGSYELQVSLPGQAPWRREFQFTAGELVQILVNFFADESTPFVDIETSNQNKLALTDAQQVDIDAEPGTLSGRITSSEDGQGIAGVRVFVSGVADEQVTDEDGSYTFELPPGEYSLSVLAARFNTRTLENIPISSEQTTRQDLKLSPAGSELPEYVVVEPFVEGSLASVLDERRQSSSVSDILSAEQFSKTGDSDAAAALTRVPGLSLVGGKFVFVRGLGERYSSTLINGMPVPSPDPTRKVIPLDIFPTSVIQSISVQKTLSPDMPGEFGGGTVNLRTNGIPDEGFFSIGISATYDTRTSFKSVLTSKGSPTDFLGFDNGTRNLPESFDVIADKPLSLFNAFNPDGLPAEQVEQLGEDLAGVLSIDSKTAPPSFGLNLSAGDVFAVGETWRWGFTAALDYDQDWDDQQEIRRQFSAGEEELDLLSDNILDVSNEVVDTSVFFTTELSSLDDRHSINYTSLLVRQSIFDNRITSGFSFRDGFNVTRQQIRWRENEAFINQLNGHHEIDLLQGLKLDWGVSHDSSAFEEPNTREFRLDERLPGQVTFSRFADSNIITFNDLDEKDKYASFKLRLDSELSSWLDFGFYSGISILDRERVADLRRFRYAPAGPDSRDPEVLALPLEQIFSPEFIGENGFRLTETTQATDSYTADQELSSYFFGSDWLIADRIRIDGGVRIEDNRQQVISFEPFVANPNQNIASIFKKDYLPAVSLTWTISEALALKLAFSESVIRPQFREFADNVPFNDPLIDAEVLGNADLVQSDLENYDVRLEWFFSDADFVALSGFYKTIDNPIELVTLPTDSANLATLRNAESGELLGGEIEFRAGLGNFFDFMSNFYLSGNFSLIDSEVSLPDAVAQTTATRRLQGQSDSIINIILGYENFDAGLDITIAFNQQGSRITAAGVSGIPNSVESPPALLDLVVKKQWTDRLRVSLEASNLLDQSTTFNVRDEIERQFKSGREIKLGLDYSL